MQREKVKCNYTYNISQDLCPDIYSPDLVLVYAKDAKTIRAMKNVGVSIGTNLVSVGVSIGTNLASVICCNYSVYYMLYLK